MLVPARHRGPVALSWPRWVDPGAPRLREVAPRLYVGSEFAPMVPGNWLLIVDLYGPGTDSVVNANRDDVYRSAPSFLRLPFRDGEPVPAPIVDRSLAAIAHGRRHGNVLVHCQAGLSRSASVAYAALRVIDGIADMSARALVYVPGYPQWPHPVTLGSVRAQVDRMRLPTPR